MAVCFNLVNGFINGYYFSSFALGIYLGLAGGYPLHPGNVPLWAGVVINWWSDQILLDLRKGGKKGYFIPQGRFVPVGILSEFLR